MSETGNELTCSQCRELAAELALNVLPEREQPGVLRHLQRCAGCRNTVEAHAAVAQRLLELLPDAEPPAGFEHRTAATLSTPVGPTDKPAAASDEDASALRRR